MRIKLPILTQALTEGGSDHELAINASNEVACMVDEYRREMTRMMEMMEQRLSRQLQDQVGQCMARMDEHFTHIGEVQLEQHKLLQQLASGLMYQGKRLEVIEGDVCELKSDVSVLKSDVSELKLGLSATNKRLDTMDAKLDRLLEQAAS